MPREGLAIATILTLLEEGPDKIAAATAPLTPAQLRTSPAAGEWSIVEVLAHLRACADEWGACIAAMLAEEHPTLRAVDPRTYMLQTDYPALEFGPSFAAYAAQRAALVAQLRPLTSAQWARAATMRGSGAPIVRTVHGFGNRLVVHERPHIKQIQRAARSLLS